MAEAKISMTATAFVETLTKVGLEARAEPNKDLAVIVAIAFATKPATAKKTPIYHLPLDAKVEVSVKDDKITFKSDGALTKTLSFEVVRQGVESILAGNGLTNTAVKGRPFVKVSHSGSDYPSFVSMAYGVFAQSELGLSNESVEELKSLITK